MRKLIGLFALLVLLSSGNALGQQVSSRDWWIHSLDSIFQEAETMTGFSGEIKRLQRERKRWADSTLVAGQVVPVLRKWYEYGYFADAREGLRDWADYLPAPHPFRDTFRCLLFYEIARSYYLQDSLDAVVTWATRSIAEMPEGSTYPYDATNALGAVYRDRGQSEQALGYFTTATQMARRQPGVPVAAVATLYFNLVKAHFKQRNPTEALLALRALETHLLTAKATPDWLWVYGEIVKLYTDQGLYEAAERAAVRGYALFQDLNVVTEEDFADFLLNRGRNYSGSGAYDEAIISFGLARQIYESQVEPPQEKIAYTFRNEGNAHGYRKAFSLAERAYLRSLAINRSVSDSFQIAEEYTNLGVNSLEAGAGGRRAIDYFNRALIFRKALGVSGGILANDYVNLADAYLALGYPDTAQLYNDSARYIEEPLLGPRHPQLGYTYLNRARIFRMAGSPEEAIHWAQKSLRANHEDFSPANDSALPPIAKHGKFDYFFAALLLKGQLFSTLGGAANVALAQKHFARARELLGAVKGQLISRTDQITLADFNARLADAMLDNAYYNWARTQDTSWVITSLNFIERAKAEVLRTAIVGNQARSAAGIPDSLRRREDELTANIGYHKRQLAAGGDATTLVEHQRELFTATQARKQLLAKYARDYPRYFQLKQAAQPPSVAEIQAVLGPNELLCSYFTGQEHLYLLTLDQNVVDLHRIPLPPRLGRNVTALVKGITRSLDRLYLRKSHDLFQLLFPEPERIIGKKLILIPDGPLLKVPFAALLTEAVRPSEAVDFGTLPYLLRNGAISYAPSASLFYRSRLQEPSPAPATAPRELLAFAPVFGNGEISVTTQRNIGENTLLSALPATRTELESLQTVFGEYDRPATTLIGPAATEAALYARRVGEAHYLHFATHGFVNEEYPDLSGLALYPDTTSAEDNFLSVGEVYNLKLNAELVTLSACETGLGKVASGEGVLGFTRAFLYAGADNLLVSLWQVQDEATAGLMVDFYRRILATDGEFSSQLRAAKLGMIAAGKYSHPYYWSAFVLIGE